MKIKVLVGVVALVGMVVCANAQVTVRWFADGVTGSTPAIDPISGIAVMSSTNDWQGALFQLVQAAGAAPIAPTAEFGTGTGVTAGDALNMYSWAGVDENDPGTMYAEAAGFSGSLSFYVRIWDQPTSGSGNMPAAYNYGSGLIGGYYYDSEIEIFSGTAGNPSLADFKFTAPGQGDWTFLAVPEPGSMALGLLGLGVILIRRRLMRK